MDANFCDIKEEKVVKNEFEQLLRHYYKDLSHDINLFKRTPFIVSIDLIKELQKLTAILNDVLQKIVTHYFKDKRIQTIFDLDKELEEVLKIGEHIPYKVGMYRPDILFDSLGKPKICEIGCRYPINGWMISYYMNKILNELDTESTSNYESIPNQLNFISEIANTFDKNEVLYYVHNKEKGTEAHLLFKELEKQGFSIEDISPNNFDVVEEKLMFNKKQATQFILEMDREELKEIDIEALKVLASSKKCVNDLRSIILVHDKRVLSVLYDEKIMGDYLSKEDYIFLKKFLIPSYPLIDKGIIDELKSTKDNWILKKSSGGRGIDMYVKDECTNKEWANLINKECKNFMGQKYVEQQVFSVEKENLHMVGMLLAFNEKSFGLGIYRGSQESIINVHSGAYIFPSVVKK